MTTFTFVACCLVAVEFSCVFALVVKVYPFLWLCNCKLQQKEDSGHLLLLILDQVNISGSGILEDP